MSNQSYGSDPIVEDLHREFAFLRYRRSVVSRWPDGAHKVTALAGIDWRIGVVGISLPPARKENLHVDHYR
jgi:hypothetical protein